MKQPEIQPQNMRLISKEQLKALDDWDKACKESQVVQAKGPSYTPRPMGVEAVFSSR